MSVLTFPAAPLHAQAGRDTYGRTILWLGEVAVLLGLTVMLGWHARIPFLIQLQVDMVPMPYNAALSMLLGGLVLVALAKHHTVSARWLAGAGLVGSAATMTQYFTNADLGIDQFFVWHNTSTLGAFSTYPGRMALSTCFCYLLLNTGFLLFTLRTNDRLARTLAAICAAVVIAVVIATVIGYSTDLQPLFGWSATTYMALHSALGIFILAVGLLACGVSSSGAQMQENHLLIATAGFIVMTIATLLLWSGLLRQRDEQLQASLEDDLRWLTISINSVYREHVNSIERMARRWEASVAVLPELWQIDANSYLGSLTSITALFWVDRDGLPRWQVSGADSVTASLPELISHTPLGQDLLRAADTRRLAYSSPNLLRTDEGVFFLIRALHPMERFDGYLLAEINSKRLFSEIDELHAATPFRVLFGDSVVFQNDLVAQLDDAVLNIGAPLGINNGGWSLQVFSRNDQEGLLRSRMPDIVLGAGLLLACLIAVILRLWGSSSLNLLAARRANLALKQSQQQLNQFHTTLDRTLDCVFMFDLAELRFFYGNEGALRLIGCTHAQLFTMHPWDLNSDFSETEFRRLIAPLVAGEQDSLTEESVLHTAGGELIPIEYFLQYIAPRGEPPRFVAFVRDITQRKRIDTMKNEFVSTVSHELRTPLTSISGALGLVRGGALGELSPALQPMVDIAYNNSQRLTHLINDLLDIEKLAAGKLNFDFAVQPLMPLVQQAVAAITTYGSETGVSVRCSPLTPDVQVRVDGQRLLQILANLLSNAIKFSPDHGNVDVVVGWQAERVRISVRDYGRGIPAEFRPHIFQKFAQADSSDTRKQSGTGLGLAISQELAQRMGAQLDYASREGEGSCFFIDLPVIQPTQLDSRNEGPPTILVIEDEPDAATILSTQLREAGYQPVLATTGAQGMQALEQGAFTALLLDLNLPDMNGLDIIRKIKQNAATRHLPIVVISAGIEDGKLALKGEMSELSWFSKPVETRALLDELDAYKRSSGVRAGRVLHIEDDRDLHTVIAGMLGPLCEVELAGSLQEARHKLKEGEFLAIILDLELPDGSGWELLPLIQTQQPGARLILLTGTETTPEQRDKVDAALLKSRVTPRQLLDALQRRIDQTKT